MRRLPAAALVGVLFAGAACSSSGSSPTAESQPEAPSSTSSLVESSLPLDSTASTTGVPSDDAAPEVPGATGAEQLAALEADPDVSPIDVSLAEWSALMAPLPGAPGIMSDDSLFPSGTHAFAELDANYDELTPEQQQVFDTQLLALFDEERAIDRFFLFDDDAPSAEADAGGETEDAQGLVRPVAFAASPSTPASPELRAEVRALANALRSELGGPELKIWVEIHPPGAFGDDVLAKNSSLGVWSPERLALREVGEDVDCILRITDVEMSSFEVRGVFVHELVHCWQFSELGHSVARQNAMDDWAKEGMAAYYGEKVGGTTRFSADWWGAYLNTRLDGDNSWSPYPRPPDTYDAIGLWSRIAEGTDIVGAMQAALVAAPDDAAMYSAATAGLGDGASWIAAGVVQNPGWGPGWTASGPGMPSQSRPADSVEVPPLTITVESVAAAMQRTTNWAVTPVDGARGSVMKLFGDGGGVVRVGDSDFVIPPGATKSDDWCLGECLCPNGESAFATDRILPGATELTSALVGAAAQGSSLLVEVTVFDAADESWDCDREPDLGETTAGLVGTWRANPESVAMVLEQASVFGGSDATALDVAGTTGEVLMTFAEDGSGKLVYNDVTFFINDGPITDLTLSGAGTFRWGVQGGSLQISGTQFSFAVNSSALGDEPLEITSDDVPAVGVTSLTGIVAGDELTITASEGTAGQAFFPISWRRQG